MADSPAPNPVLSSYDAARPAGDGGKRLPITPEVSKAFRGSLRAKTRLEAATMADLKALDVTGLTGGETAVVDGYYAARDGGDGQFTWDPASSEADDGGMVIAPNAGAGRWKRAIKGDRIRVLWYGARPGVTTDQTALLQKAIDKVAALGGGVVELPQGTFRIGIPNVPLRISGSNIILEGKGRRSTILQQTPGMLQQAMLEIGDPLAATNGNVSRNITIRDIGFDTNNCRSAKAIRLRFSCWGLRIENCDCWNSPVEAGVPYHNNGDVHMVDMSVTIEGIRNLWITGCRVQFCVQLTSNALAGVDGLFITENWIEDPVSYGVAITGILRAPGFKIRNVVISNNVFKNVSTGINIGRDQTLTGIVELTGDQQIVKNITIHNNLFVVGGDHSGTFSNGISVCTYQNEISGVSIKGNTLMLADGTALSGQVGIQITMYEFNWFGWQQGGVAPVISSVNVDTDTITSNKAHWLFENMAVRFERTTLTDKLPAPLIENRRYRVHRVSTTEFTLTDFRTGRTINLDSQAVGNIKMFFAPVVQDVEICDNLITGFSEAIRINSSAGIGIRDNRCVGGSIYFSPGSINEDVTVQDNAVNKGFISCYGTMINGKCIGNHCDVNDGYFSAGGGRVINFAPSQAVWSQDWIVRDNTVNVFRLDGSPIFRVVSGFAANLGQGNVTLWDVDGNICTNAVSRPFDDLFGSRVMIVRWGSNTERPADKAFKANSDALQARFLASTKLNMSLHEVQSAAESSAKALFPNALLFEGVTANAQAVATLTGVSFGAEGRAVNWRHCVSTRTTPAGLWALSGSATAGHSAHALYAFEKDGILTLRQLGAAPGTLIINAQDGVIGDITGGDYRQAVIDVTHRRGLPTHFLVSIDRTGALTVYVEGLPVAVAETLSGAAPAWNNALLPSSPVLSIGYFDTTFPSFEGAFYGFDVLNFAPASPQAQSLFAGGMAALPEYGLVHPAEMVVNGGFADGSSWNTGAPEAGATISGGTANFINAAAGVGFQQSGTGVNYRKGRYYRLKFNLVSYGAGLMYVSAGDGLANLRTPFAPVDGTNVFEGKAGSSGGITTFRANGGTTLSIDNLSIIPLGAVASYVFDPGLGYQIEDKAGLKNHLVLAPSGVTHLRPALTARFTGKITSATGAGNFIVRNGFMLEPGHLITRIQAYSASGGSFTVGEGPGGQAASLVASTTLAAGATMDLVLLKQTTASLRMYAALGTAADLQLTVIYEVPRPLP